jgi:hypothetical protein
MLLTHDRDGKHHMGSEKRQDYFLLREKPRLAGLFLSILLLMTTV